MSVLWCMLRRLSWHLPRINCDVSHLPGGFDQVIKTLHIINGKFEENSYAVESWSLSCSHHMFWELHISMGRFGENNIWQTCRKMRNLVSSNFLEASMAASSKIITSVTFLNKNIFFNLCHEHIFLGNFIWYFVFSVISQCWDDAGSWNSSSLMEDQLMLHGQYHGCWCPGDVRSQAISSNGLDLVNLENISVLAVECFREVRLDFIL